VIFQCRGPPKPGIGARRAGALVRPEVVVEVTYLTWTEDNLLRQVSYQGQREDKPARQVVRAIPHLSRHGGP
jgi:ATP-dependent DNA ligase